MEIKAEAEYLSHCRLCLEAVSDSEGAVAISEAIESWFFDLTQIHLKAQDFYQSVCESCHRDLRFCSEFRKSLIEKQNKFLMMLDETSDSAKLTIDPLESIIEAKTPFPEEAEYVEQLVHEVEEHKKSPASTRKQRQCPQCGILVRNLSEHQKTVHVQVKRFCCDFCDYSCYFKTKITRHLQKHIPKEARAKFPCVFCTFFTSRKDALKSHMLTMHQEREKVFLCVECGKKFYKKSQLNIHDKAVHKKIKNHLCNLCGKSFFSVKDLEMHVKRHEKVKDEICNVCGNQFYCSLDLRRHLKIHSEPKIVCEVDGCVKKFYTNSKLKAHIKVRHEGAKDFFCDYCSSCFSQFNNLKRHINSVHKSLRIRCLVNGCTYSVARKDKYKNHLMSQHKNLSDKSKEAILKNVKFE